VGHENKVVRRIAYDGVRFFGRGDRLQGLLLERPVLADAVNGHFACPVISREQEPPCSIRREMRRILTGRDRRHMLQVSTCWRDSERSQLAGGSDRCEQKSAPRFDRQGSRLAIDRDVDLMGQLAVLGREAIDGDPFIAGQRNVKVWGRQHEEAHAQHCSVGTDGAAKSRPAVLLD
jgi:hypothetical protein